MTTNVIDYSIDNLSSLDGVSVVSLKRNGLMPMPLDIKVTMNDGSEKWFYIPLEEMRGEKEIPSNWVVLKDWAWAYPTYELELKGINMRSIRSVEIDPKNNMADVDKTNNKWQLEK